VRQIAKDAERLKSSLESVLAASSIPPPPAEYITAAQFAEREGITPKSAHARLNGNAALESGMCRVPGVRNALRCWWVKGTPK